MDLESQFVPENSTLDRELAGIMHDWNDRIGKENYENLGEDVNSLIRDYLRKVLRPQPLHFCQQIFFNLWL